MKKIVTMIMAAASCLVAFGECSYAPAKSTAWVYKWKFSGKTTYGVKTGKTKVASGLCGYNGGGDACTVRSPASLKIEGYTWICEPGCGSESFEMFAEANEVFWQRKPFKASLAGGVSMEVANIIGKKAKQFETAGTATFTEFVDSGNVQEGIYTLTYAGLGKYDLKHGRVKSVSGSFAGILNQPHYIAKDLCGTAGYWTCDTLSLVCEGPSIAYGKWSCKFQKSAAKKYLNGGKLPKIPSWVVQMNQQ